MIRVKDTSRYGEGADDQGHDSTLSTSQVFFNFGTDLALGQRHHSGWHPHPMPCSVVVTSPISLASPRLAAFCSNLFECGAQDEDRCVVRARPGPGAWL